jgi:crotonobetainyl-CoA:carnitine CoA-transferase CaiB-like acyl-CoA transferase
MAPHGVYPARGDDSWVTIAVADDRQWQGLARLIGEPSLAADPRFAAAADRVRNAETLNRLLARWTSDRDVNEVAAVLQQQGIAAHPSWNSADIVSDPHLRSRGAILDVRITDEDIRPAVRVPMQFSKTSETGIERGAPPELGEGEEEIFGELLGLTVAERRALEQEEVIC